MRHRVGGERRQDHPVDGDELRARLRRADEHEAATLSGRSDASMSAMRPPIELPTSTAGSVHEAPRKRSSSARLAPRPEERPASGVRPKPAKSGARTRPCSRQPLADGEPVHVATAEAVQQHDRRAAPAEVGDVDRTVEIDEARAHRRSMPDRARRTKPDAQSPLSMNRPPPFTRAGVE